MPTPEELQQDPDFLSAHPADQARYLASSDPDFKSASAEDQAAYLAHVTKAPMSGEPDKNDSVGKGIYDTTVGPLVSLGKSEYNYLKSKPMIVSKDDPNASHGAFDVDPNDPLVQAGKGIIQSHEDTAKKALGSARQGKYSEAAGYGLATAVPVLGPPAAKAGEDIGTPGKGKYGAGEALGIIGAAAHPLMKEYGGKVAAPVIRAAGRAANVALDNPEITAGVLGTLHGGPVQGLEGAVGTGMVGRAVRRIPRVPESVTNYGLPKTQGLVGNDYVPETEKPASEVKPEVAGKGVPYGEPTPAPTPGAALGEVKPTESKPAAVTGEALAKTPEDRAVEKLQKTYNDVKAKADKAKAELDAYAASEAQGISAPKEVLKAHESAQNKLAEAELHLDTAKEAAEKARNPKAEQSTAEGVPQAGTPKPITPADVESTPGTSMRPLGEPKKATPLGNIETSPLDEKGEPKWPANYTKTALNNEGQGGANYSKADLDALKEKHGIKPVAAEEAKPAAKTMTASAAKPTILNHEAVKGHLDKLDLPPNYNDPKVAGKLMAESVLRGPAEDVGTKARNANPEPTRQTVKPLGPDATDEQIDAKIEELKGLKGKNTERRANPRPPEEVQYRDNFRQAVKDLGTDATDEQIDARIEELKKGQKDQAVGQRKPEEAVKPKETKAFPETAELEPGDLESKVKEQVSYLPNEDLKELMRSYGLDPEDYNFSRREPLREGGSRHPIERYKAVDDLMEKLTDKEKETLGRNAADFEHDASMSQKRKAERAKSLFPQLRKSVESETEEEPKRRIRR